MKLADDEDVETMVDLYCGNGSGKNAPIHLFAELVGMEQNASDEEDGAEEPRMVAPISYVDKECGCEEEGGGDHWDEEVDSDGDPNVDDVPDDIDNEDINASSIGEQMRHILIHNNPGPHISLIDPDAAYVVEFPEELFIGQRFSCKEECVAEGCNWRVRAAFIKSSQMWEIRKFVGPHTYTSTLSVLIAEMQARFQYRVSYRKAWIAKQMAMEQLYGDYDSSYNELQGWIAAMQEYVPRTVIELQGRPYYGSDGQLQLATLMPRIGQQQVDQIEAGHVFVEYVRDTMVANRRLARSYGVDLRNRRCECRRFETLHYPCAYVVATCAKINVNIEQYVDDVYTLERTLRVWENEFPVLPDLSTWEVPLTTFELLPDRELRRNPRGRPQSSRIRNEMDIREKSDGKRCGICRLSGHSRNKCPNRNFHVGQSSGSGRN
ncbi:hypothetical protein GOBAR_DD13859 [Gossypium barbadense]|nr:hypothetical protein GOBAR_DD13859 [Gossypium barbadense]